MNDHKPEIYDENGSFYSELEVIKSNVGYFIGRYYWDNEGKFWDAGTRESEYFPTQEAAEQAMLNGFPWRNAAETIALYESRGLKFPF